MRGRRFVVVFAAGLSACSLFVSLDSLSTSSAVDGGDNDASPDGGSPSANDANATPDTSFTAPDGAPLSPYVLAVLADSPVGYWRLNETSGTNVRDEIGDAHPGKLVGTVKLGEKGIDGNAASFDGNNSCIDVGPNFLFPAPAPFSVELWISAVSYANSPYFVTTEINIPSGLRDGWSIGLQNSGQAYIEGWNSETDASVFILGAYAQIGGGGPVVLNTWTQLDTTYDGNGVAEIWVDGVLRNHATEPGGIRNRGSLSFGCRGASTMAPIRPFTGLIDEISIYDKVLTKDRILAHKAARVVN
ncbi:MAG: LamG domain-containing protein [Polyangiaceae bacterium]